MELPYNRHGASQAQAGPPPGQPPPPTSVVDFHARSKEVKRTTALSKSNALAVMNTPQHKSTKSEAPLQDLSIRPAQSGQPFLLLQATRAQVPGAGTVPDEDSSGLSHRPSAAMPLAAPQPACGITFSHSTTSQGPSVQQSRETSTKTPRRVEQKREHKVHFAAPSSMLASTVQPLIIDRTAQTQAQAAIDRNAVDDDDDDFGDAPSTPLRVAPVSTGADSSHPQNLENSSKSSLPSGYIHSSYSGNHFIQRRYVRHYYSAGQHSSAESNDDSSVGSFRLHVFLASVVLLFISAPLGIYVYHFGNEMPPLIQAKQQLKLYLRPLQVVTEEYLGFSLALPSFASFKSFDSNSSLLLTPHFESHVISMFPDISSSSRDEAHRAVFEPDLGTHIHEGIDGESNDNGPSTIEIVPTQMEITVGMGEHNEVMIDVAQVPTPQSDEIGVSRQLGQTEQQLQLDVSQLSFGSAPVIEIEINSLQMESAGAPFLTSSDLAYAVETEHVAKELLLVEVLEGIVVPSISHDEALAEQAEIGHLGVVLASEDSAASTVQNTQNKDLVNNGIENRESVIYESQEVDHSDIMISRPLSHTDLIIDDDLTGVELANGPITNQDALNEMEASFVVDTMHLPAETSSDSAVSSTHIIDGVDHESFDALTDITKQRVPVDVNGAIEDVSDVAMIDPTAPHTPEFDESSEMTSAESDTLLFNIGENDSGKTAIIETTDSPTIAEGSVFESHNDQCAMSELAGDSNIHAEILSDDSSRAISAVVREFDGNQGAQMLLKPVVIDAAGTSDEKLSSSDGLAVESEVTLEAHENVNNGPISTDDIVTEDVADNAASGDLLYDPIESSEPVVIEMFVEVNSTKSDSPQIARFVVGVESLKSALTQSIESFSDLSVAEVSLENNGKPTTPIFIDAGDEATPPLLDLETASNAVGESSVEPLEQKLQPIITPTLAEDFIVVNDSNEAVDGLLLSEQTESSATSAMVDVDTLANILQSEIAVLSETLSHAEQLPEQHVNSKLFTIVDNQEPSNFGVADELLSSTSQISHVTTVTSNTPSETVSEPIVVIAKDQSEETVVSQSFDDSESSRVEGIDSCMVSEVSLAPEIVRAEQHTAPVEKDVNSLQITDTVSIDPSSEPTAEENNGHPIASESVSNVASSEASEVPISIPDVGSNMRQQHADSEDFWMWIAALKTQEWISEAIAKINALDTNGVVALASFAATVVLGALISFSLLGTAGHPSENLEQTLEITTEAPIDGSSSSGGAGPSTFTNAESSEANLPPQNHTTMEAAGKATGVKKTVLSSVRKVLFGDQPSPHVPQSLPDRKTRSRRRSSIRIADRNQAAIDESSATESAVETESEGIVLRRSARKSTSKR